ncbi:MAG TPA: hypothetical protein VGM90_02615 [Kofleriaceae bacterium]
MSDYSEASEKAVVSKTPMHDVAETGRVQDLGEFTPDRPLSENNQRAALVAQISSIGPATLHIIEHGVAIGGRALSVPDKIEPSLASELFMIAVAAAVAGISGGVASWWAGQFAIAATGRIAQRAAEGAADAIARAELKAAAESAKMAEKFTQKFLEDSSKDGVKNFAKQYTKLDPTTPTSGYVQAFMSHADHALASVEASFTANLADLQQRLYTLSTPDLVRIAAPARLLTLSVNSLVEAAANETVIAWTNFLARARYGALDPWNATGSVALAGAASSDGRAPIDNDIGWTNSGLLNLAQRGWDDRVGVLEVNLDRHGNVVPVEGYTLRLDNVGPKVRARVRTMGLVRDLPVNKVVKVCHVERGFYMPVASIGIGADGRVRDSVGLRSGKTSKKTAGELTQCAEGVLAGTEAGPCLEPAFDYSNVTKYAEIAQGLSLMLLEEK